MGLVVRRSPWTSLFPYTFSFFCLLTIAALFSRIDHDESQYVAAVALTEHSLPFRDFLYLQTPLQPLLLAPLGWLTDGYLFLMLRVANGAMAGLTLCVIYRVLREDRIDRETALLATTLMGASYVFLFIASMARNDVMPMLLNAIGIWMLLRGSRRSGEYVSYGLAGIAIAAAAAAKISYGIPAAAVGLWALWRWRKLGPYNVIALAAGGIVGLLPWLVLWQIAPAAANFGVFEYSLTAPQQWRALNDQAYQLGATETARRVVRYLAEGPVLPSLLIVAAARWQSRKDREPERAEPLLMLDILIVAGLVAAILPEPTFRQYLGPILSPLFIRFGLTFETLGRWRDAARALLIVSAVASLVVSQRHNVRNMINGTSPVIEATLDAHWIGNVLRRSNVSGELAGIRPERLVDSGWPLDRRFVTGPFIYRTVNLLSLHEEEAFAVVSHRNLDRAFAQRPPAGIVVGTEYRGAPLVPRGLDQPMRAWAINHRYIPVVAPSQQVTLYIRPRASDGSPIVVSAFPTRTESPARSALPARSSPAW